jgi:hypothetical protein
MAEYRNAAAIKLNKVVIRFISDHRAGGFASVWRR